jgi:hypothetical protein
LDVLKPVEDLARSTHIQEGSREKAELTLISAKPRLPVP